MQAHAHDLLFLGQPLQGIRRIGVGNVHPDNGAEAAGETLNAFDKVFIVVVARVLDEGRLLHVIQVHLVQNHFHRLEPVNAGVAVSINNRHSSDTLHCLVRG